MTDYSDLLGCRFFRKINDKLEILKVISFVNLETARVINIETGVKSKIYFKTLKEKYICLNPDGYIAFDIVDIKLKDKTIQDVIISNFRQIDINNELNVIPYCICRQNIINLYNEVIKKYDTNSVTGMCMSIDTIPEGVDYRMMLACDDIYHHISVAYYLDDKLSDILQCIRKIDLYNNVLETLYVENMKLLPKQLKEIDKVSEQSIYGGYCRTLESLLVNNDFMTDLRLGLGIIELKSISIATDGDNVLLNSTQLKAIEKSIGKQIINPIIFKYNKDIKLSNISKEYNIICDSCQNMYIIIYDTEDDLKDEYHMNESVVTAKDKLKMIRNLTTN